MWSGFIDMEIGVLGGGGFSNIFLEGFWGIIFFVFFRGFVYKVRFGFKFRVFN